MLLKNLTERKDYSFQWPDFEIPFKVITQNISVFLCSERRWWGVREKEKERERKSTWYIKANCICGKYVGVLNNQE